VERTIKDLNKEFEATSQEAEAETELPSDTTQPDTEQVQQKA
jgi:hypothetical protein